MTFADTGLFWIPSSPNIPASARPTTIPITGIIGELNLVNIGIGFTLPFEVIGAPYIDAPLFPKLSTTPNFPAFSSRPTTGSRQRVVKKIRSAKGF